MSIRRSARGGDSNFFDSIGELLRAIDQPPPKRTRLRGRPKTRSVETCPVVLHLYRKHVEWLDAYVDTLASYAPGNRMLKRVEIIRGLLLGLAEHIYEHRVRLPEPIIIKSEKDLQKAIAGALSQHKS